MNTSKKTMFSGLLISALMLASCQGGKEKAFGIENCPVIAKRVVTSSGDTVVVCDISLAKDTLVLPHTYFF